MINLLNAIYSAFTGDATLSAAFPGGLHRDRATEETTLPYVVSHVVDSTTDVSYGSKNRSHVRIKFSAFGVGHDATGSLMETFAARFDNQLLSLATGTHDSITRLTDPTPTLHRHDSQGNDVWEWAVTYEYGMTES